MNGLQIAAICFGLIGISGFVLGEVGYVANISTTGLFGIVLIEAGVHSISHFRNRKP